jgi:hypothetical protein
MICPIHVAANREFLRLNREFFTPNREFTGNASRRLGERPSRQPLHAGLLPKSSSIPVIARA